MFIFSDLHKLNYEDYIRITKKGPYKGTQAYPVGSRRYSSRHFIVTNEGVVQVWYGHLKTCDMYRKHKVGSAHIGTHHLLNVYPDNTFEFFNAGGQGEHGVISLITDTWMHQECNRGGAVISRGRYGEKVIHPVFRGLRLSLNDLSLHPDSQYKLRYKKIIPASKKATMAEYTNQLQIGRTMLSVMDYTSMKSVHSDLKAKYAQKIMQRNSDFVRARIETINEFIKEARQNNYNLDVLMHTAILGGFHGDYSYNNNPDTYRRRINEATNKGVHTYLKNKPELFTYVYREPNDFPTSATWGMDVVINDKPVVRL